MHKVVTGSLLSIGLLFSASAHAAIGKSGPPITDIPQGEQPKWITTESPRFPRIDYFSRRGDGKNPEAADHLAQDKIIKLLNPTGDIPVDNIAPLAELQILDRWHDSSTNTYWSYAGLPQQSAADHLREQIQELDDKTEAAINLSQASTDPLLKIGSAHRAHRMQQRRATFQTALKTVDLTGRGMKAQWALGELDQQLQTLIDNVSISASSDSDSPHGKVLKRMLKAAFRTADIKAADNGDFVIHASLDISEERQENNWILAKGVLKLTLFDATSLSLRGEKDWKIDIMGLTASSAIRRVLEKAEFRMKKEMRNTLVEFAAAVPAPQAPAPVQTTEESTADEAVPTANEPRKPPAATPKQESPAATAIPLNESGPISAEPL